MLSNPGIKSLQAHPTTRISQANEGSQEGSILHLTAGNRKLMRQIQVALQESDKDYIELCHLLKVAGLADSSGQGKHMVAEGMVRIGGQVETRKTAKIRANTEVFCLDTCITVVGG